jgi:hypothetical protein
VVDRSDDETSVNDAASSANMSNKKLKKEFDLYHNLINCLTRGIKRDLDLSESSSESTPKAKRTSATSSHVLEKVSFLSTPPTLGRLVRKRIHEAEPEEDIDSFERTCSLTTPPG